MATATKKPVLLSGGNPQIAMGDGDAPVEAYLAAVPDWRQDVCRQLDALIVRTVPGIHRAVKWNSPFYGLPGKGWLVSFHVYARFVKVTFFDGTSLSPAPPGGKSQDGGRWIDVPEGGVDALAPQLEDWLRQGMALPGWGKV